LLPSPSGRGVGGEGPPAAAAWAVFGWTLLVHLVYLKGDLLFAKPVSAFFFGDGLHFLETARHLAEGTTALGGKLPFHPPLVTWLLLPLWRLFSDPEPVYVASKAMMAVFNAGSFAVLYLWLRERVDHAFWIALLLPLGFGELLLSSVANSEAPYRFLVFVLLYLGLRGGWWPLAGGLLHGLAALTRAEHLAILALVVAVTAVSPRHRRFAALTALGAFLLIAPYTARNAVDVGAYNEAYAETLPEPLPTLVPVSFYGPLNFALAQTEDDIFFSRRKLPVSAVGDAILDPNHPRHNEYVVHGYRIALQEIAARPGRFLSRSWLKARHALRAFAFGWTWRDLPQGETWTRRPVDMASAEVPWAYGVALAVLVALGVYRLRRDRWLLAVAAAFVVYRLAMAVAFFPYLRGMMIAAPLVTVLAACGLAALGRKYGTGVLATLLVVLALYHLGFGWKPRSYLLKGERDAQGRILDDRTVLLKYDGFVERE